MRTTPRMTIAERIDRIERNTFGTDHAGFSLDRVALDRFELIHVRGLSRFWDNAAEDDALLNSHREILSGLFANGLPMYYLVLGEPERMSFFLGLPTDCAPGAVWPARLKAVLPGCELSVASDVSATLAPLTQFDWAAAFTGNPNPHLPVESDQPNRGVPNKRDTRLESVIRSMRGQTWAYLVCAMPVSDADIAESIARPLSPTSRVATRRYISPSFSSRSNAARVSRPTT